MIQTQTVVRVADNSGAKTAKIIGIHANRKDNYARIGDVVRISVQKVLPGSEIKQHSKHAAIVVRTKKEQGRPDGSYIRFDDNAVVLMDDEVVKPQGTRIFGPIGREIKNKGYNLIVSLAPEVL
jgi:large subunit ribosomal protein L14